MVIDIHSHVLPGIDDGSKSVETSIEMLKESYRQGVGKLIATPHFYAYAKSVEKFLTQRAEAAHRLRSAMSAADAPMSDFICGAEIAFFEGISKAEKVGDLTIEGTNLLLIEMPFEPWSDRVLDELHILLNKGLTPIIAHVERFFGFKGNAAKIEELMDWPVYIQMNAEAFEDIWHKHKYIKLLKNDQIHLLGTDCHGMHHRPPNLLKARQYIERKAGIDVLNRIDRLGESLFEKDNE